MTDKKDEKEVVTVPQGVARNAFGFYDPDHNAPGGYNLPPSHGATEFTPDAQEKKVEAAKKDAKEGDKPKQGKDQHPEPPEDLNRVQGQSAMSRGLTGTDKPVGDTGKPQGKVPEEKPAPKAK